MGYWGYELFASDHAIQIVGEISADADIDFIEAISSEKDRTAAKATLDNGLLAKLVQEYQEGLEHSRGLYSRDHKLIILTALAMEVGAHVDNILRQDIKARNETLGIPKLAKAQMGEALNVYVSGAPLDMDNVKPPPTADISDPELNRDSILMNVFTKVSCCPYEFTIDPRDFHKANPDFSKNRWTSNPGGCGNPSNPSKPQPNCPHACLSCRKTGPKLAETGGVLKHCAKCHNKEIMYCSRKCQKADWKAHKEICGVKGAAKPEQQQQSPQAQQQVSPCQTQ
ncbi:hypothetical protein K490DRAFT_53017 [Saccharata proteae CBS 121410]|uniref:MYND-type domain-containing protein n=1 Tax=Saccharata proteae CBS 121410 TaxID=1314787 RepID=A0A9P4HYY2_9PEZI|nr:hypothetical protein K490DRAFT_53017 [Saccharata proteae CBS 121410]